MWVAQYDSTRRIESRIAALEARLVAASEGVDEPQAAVAPERTDLAQRVAELERRLPDVNQQSVQVSPVRTGHSTNRTEDLRRKFLDSSLPAKDRLQALQHLRRNKELNDEVLQGALAWLQSSKDNETRRDILHQLDGITNASLRQPLLDVAATSTDSKLRERAFANLRAYVSDAAVENQLWELTRKDADPKVRELAEEALRKGSMTPERAVRLQQLLGDPQTSLDDRLTALRALHRGGADVSEAATQLAALAQGTQDVVTRANIFHALDGVQDPRLLPPLLGGLQDPSPNVRKEAAEALTAFASNPDIQQWLQYVAQSDADSKVRREAFKALEKLQKGGH
jgi:hypothetical protein